MMNTPTLYTQRLILRRFEEKDLQAVYDIFSDEIVNRFLPWFPVRSMEEARALYETRYAQAYRSDRGYRYAICLKTDDVPIGYVNVNTDGGHDLGYGLRKEFWHQGIVSEAAATVVEQVRKDGLTFVTATHDRNNPRSGGVMQRIGMKYCYSYEEQWMPKDITVVFRMYQLNLDGQDDRVYRGYWEQFPVHFVETDIGMMEGDNV